MAVISIFLTFISSFVLTSQRVVNAALGKRIGSMESSFVNHIVGAVFGGLLLILGLRTGHIYFTGIPYYLFLGGSLGVFLVYFMNFSIPVIGVMATSVCLIISQLATSLIIDHYGFINGTVLQIGYLRIAGMIFIICGTTLVLARDGKRRRQNGRAIQG